jgi:hypothetical protein
VSLFLFIFLFLSKKNPVAVGDRVFRQIVSAASYTDRPSASRRSAMHIMPHIISINFAKSIFVLPFAFCLMLHFS